jgi:hypothetical protein
MAVKKRVETREINLEITIGELNKAFNLINHYYFNDELEPVMITVNTSSKANVLGWFTPSKVWESGEGKEYHEINLVAENLSRGKMQILQTLAHEMLHLWNHQRKVKDVSRGNTYHNKRFLQSAIDSKMFEYLHESPCSKIGYSAITLNKVTYDTIDSWNLKEEAFDLSRKSAGQDKEKKKTSWLFECDCGQKARTTKPEFIAICGLCETRFEFVK